MSASQIQGNEEFNGYHSDFANKLVSSKLFWALVALSFMLAVMCIFRCVLNKLSGRGKDLNGGAGRHPVAGHHSYDSNDKDNQGNCDDVEDSQVLLPVEDEDDHTDDEENVEDEADEPNENDAMMAV